MCELDTGIEESLLAQRDHPLLSIKDVLLTDRAGCGLSGDFSLFFSRKDASQTHLSEQSEDVMNVDDTGGSEQLVFLNDNDSSSHMSALGLPTSFVTSSNTRGFRQSRKHRKSRRRTSQKVVAFCDYALYDDDAASKGFGEDLTSPAPSSIQSGVEDVSIHPEQANVGDAFTHLPSCPGVEDLSAELDGHEVTASPWMPCWDHQYGRYYFFNSETLQTTWEPPKGLELYAYSSQTMEDNTDMQDIAEIYACAPSTERTNGMNDKAEPFADGELEKEMASMFLFRKEAVDHLERHADVTLHHEDEQKASTACNNSIEEVFGTFQTWKCGSHSIDKNVAGTDNGSGGASKDVIVKRRKKKAPSLMMNIECEHANISSRHSPNVFKYWIQRFHLFSRYNAGVKLDEEGWFSVTPEAIAKHQAARCSFGVIIDAFTGVGGNAIQFALSGHYVIAIDKDPRKIEYAHHNAIVYGVADRIDFVIGDFFVVASSLQADVVFLSPPWGGPEYLDVEVYDIQTMLQPMDGMSLFKVAQSIAPSVILFLPRNVNIGQLAELSLTSKPQLSCEVERNFLNGKLKAVTAYYGQFACVDSR